MGAMQISSRASVFFLFLLFTSLSFSCGKGGGGGTTGGGDPCSGVTVSVSGTVSDVTVAGGSNGSITVSATGGSGFTYKLNTGAYQASGTFSGLVAGVYTITAKSATGCTGSKQFTVAQPDVCSGVTVTGSVVTTAGTPCAIPGTGSITVTASGGNGTYTYSLDAGPYQGSNVFTAATTGNHTITIRDGLGCLGTVSASVAGAAAGPLFAAVKVLINDNCTRCHNASQTEGGINFTIDCNIVLYKDRIKARAVDGNPTFMPQDTGPLPLSERQKITNWINAGGTYIN
jgi:SprB repeat